MDARINGFKAALRSRRLQIGLWSSLCSPIVAELVGHSGFDWILIDMEHAPNDVLGVMSQMQAMATGTATPIVRPPANDAVLIKRVLDVGAQTLILPFVETEEDARRAVEATRYAPDGVRGVTASSRAAGFGRIKDYLRKAAEELCVVVQIETSEAMDRLDAIAAVQGVDAVFIGPSDLSASMGCIGEPSHPAVQAVIQTAARRLAEKGMPAGILAFSETDARRYIDWGYTFVAVGSDLSLLTKGADALARGFAG